MIVLGIETSCDETAISVVEASGDLESLSFRLLGSAIHSQVDMHALYGGVYPNLAKREHIKNLPIVYKQALENANISEDKTEMIAVTVGPGLEPALWTGIKFAEELGKSWGKAVIPTNHMEGHIVSALFDNQKIKFPAIALLISGGHTELVLLKSWVSKEAIGDTQDDAVGEAFDKVARMMKLPYPGGPEISKLAEEARKQNIHLENKFPRPMLHSKDFNFSFSGLKTAVLYYLKNLQKTSRERLSERDWREKEEIFQQKNTPFARENVFADSSKSAVESKVVIPQEIKMAVAREFEDAVIETLVSKTKAAIEEYNPKTLIIGGGVIANKALRENFIKLKENYPDIEILIPEKSLTTDNATMIAAAGFIEYLRDPRANRELKAQGNLKI